jgi:hypothetical protein
MNQKILIIIICLNNFNQDEKNSILSNEEENENERK